MDKYTSGCPTRVHLGPLLFHMFVSDLPTALLKSQQCCMYADDATVYFSDISAEVVDKVPTDDLTRLTTRLGMNGLATNVHKTQYTCMFSINYFPFTNVACMYMHVNHYKPIIFWSSCCLFVVLSFSYFERA